MKKIRIENTVGIIWQIKKDGTDHDMSGHTIKLWLYNSLTGDLLVPDFTVSKSVVTFLFAGDKQRYTGVYSLKLQDTTDGFSTIDTDAFELVTRSALADGSDGNITTETVQLTSEMQMAIKGDNGDSAYTVAVRGGFSGTEAEWLASLKGDKGDAFVYSDFTEDQILNLQKPAADAASDADAQTELCKTATDAAVKAKIEIEANELNRKAAEDARKAAELEREANEALRKSTEEQRDAAEEQRKAAELERDAAEQQRKAAELERDATEQQRKAAELECDNNEALRKSTESARDAAEQQRKTAELERDATEQQRKTAELERDTDFTKIKSDVETALQQTSAACQKIDDKIDTFDKLTTGKVIITLSSNQVADSLLGKKIYIMNSSDNTALYVLEWQGITLVQDVADGKAFYVIAEETSNYKTPRTVVFTAVAGATYNVSLQYECELLTLTATVESDPDPSGINIVVNGTSYVFDANNKIEIKIPFGTKYRILPGYSFGKITPSTEYRTASVASYAKTLSYKAGALGVCIAMLDGTTRAIAGFDTSELDNAVGVAVITERTHVVVRSFSLQGGAYGGATLLYGASDFNDGYGNTDILRKAGANPAIIADRCAYKNGRTPYIPAVNQFQDLVTNYTQLAAGLQLFGETLNVKSGGWWTSTEYNVSNAWCFNNGVQSASNRSNQFGWAPVVDF